MYRWHLISLALHGILLGSLWQLGGNRTHRAVVPLRTEVGSRAPTASRPAAEAPIPGEAVLSRKLNELAGIHREIEAISHERMQELAKLSPQHSIPAARKPGEALVSATRDLAETFLSALKIEQAINEAYRDLQAADLASQHKVPFATAKESVPLAAQIRDPIREADLRKKTDDPRIQKVRRQAAAQLDAMLSRARSMRQNARRISAPRTKSMRLSYENLQNHAPRVEGVRRVGAGKPQYRGLNLSLWMRGLGTGGRTAGSGGSPEGGDIPMDIPSNPPEEVDAPVPNPEVGARPGRKLVGEAKAENWLYVDSWHYIGPFPNRSRSGIDTRFPPETVIDLDATYAGREGAAVNWEFFQSDKPIVSPPRIESDTIFYFYSEIYSDVPRDVWVAMGSDDQGTYWINDMLVWSSGTGLKACRPDEGFRKVHLEKGFNRVLVRLENSIGGGAFCFLIYPKTV